MKKLFTLCITVFLFAAISKGQNQVITSTGEIILGKISSVIGKTLSIEDNSGNIIAVKLLNITKIMGPVSESRIKAIKKVNPQVNFGGQLTTNESIVIQKQISLTEKTPGDLIQLSAQLRLAGFCVGIGTTTLYYAGIFDNEKDFQKQAKTIKTVGIISGVVGLGLYIAGEATQIKAGKLMNKNKSLTLAPASEGIGIALKF